MSDTTDAALDALLVQLHRFGTNTIPREAARTITAMRTERAKDHAEINLKADFIEATLNQLAASEETIESLRSERDAAFARESAAYARGVQAAANLLDSMRRDPQYAGEGCDPIIAAIRALADAPPVPVVGVKPLVWMDIDGAGPIPCLYADTPFGNYYIDYASTGNGRGYRAYFVNGPTIYLGRDITAAKAAAQADYEARILAALLPQAGGNDP